MFTYHLSVAMSDNTLTFDDTLLQAIKEAITISNNSFSAIRYKRSIEYIKLLDPNHILLRMHSRDKIQPTRSLSSLSRALVQNERDKGSGLLEGHLINGCVFNAKVVTDPAIPDGKSDNLSHTELIHLLIEMAFGTKYDSIASQTLDAVKQILIDALNPIKSNK